MLRIPILLLLILPLAAAKPLALASPPDPLWLAGVYDGADGDDAVTLILDRAGSDHVARVEILAPAAPAQPLTIGPDRGRHLQPPPTGGRAPPGTTEIVSS
jgi:hypothetical protein